MDEQVRKKLLVTQIQILQSASEVLRESHSRVDLVLKKSTDVLTIEEKESCEALTARFSRLCDFLFQRAFRTLDQIELQDEGTAIDRLNRMEKRGIITSAALWRRLRDLRNEIAHEYLIEKSDAVLHEAHKQTHELLDTVKRFQDYLKAKVYV